MLPEHSGHRGNKSRVFFQNELLLTGDPVGFDFELASVGTALGQRNGAMPNVAHLGSVLGLDGFGVVPEIETIDVPVVKPDSDMVRWSTRSPGLGSSGKSRVTSVPFAVRTG